MRPEHVDIVVVGAGLSGIGAACHLADRLPHKSVAILEARGASGGTWDLFRYPGVRSDSDMFTLGYSFQPWEQDHAIAEGSEILSYIRRAATTHGVDEKVRYHHQVTSAHWSSQDCLWTIEAHRRDTGETVRLTCGFLYVCAGYYSYDRGHAPTFKGTDRFRGRIVHPQFWPQDLDYEGKHVVVIGSGATAVTLVPALARKAELVTMLQRSPSYVMNRPTQDRFGARLRRVLPAKAADPLVRWKYILKFALFYQLSRRRPEKIKAFLRKQVQLHVPADFDVDTHFHPRYDPWDQRVCAVPDGDLFAAISAGRADVVTDTIDTFTETGIALGSGTHLEADIVVTATGLSLRMLGGMSFTVDGTAVDLSKTVSYKGMMLSGVPNFAVTIGYTNASWTLKADLVANYVCRLLKHMDSKGYQQVTALAPAADQPTEPLITLTSGYVKRGINLLPRQGATAPWRLYQNYPRDLLLLRYRSLHDKGVRFSRISHRVGPSARPGVERSRSI